MTALPSGSQSSQSEALPSKPLPKANASESRPTAVDVVKNGVFPRYPTTTIGKAFEGTFQNAKWESFSTAKGEIVVEFTGTITKFALLNAFFLDVPPQHCGEKELLRLSNMGMDATCEQEVPVRFQFLISAADPSIFQLGISELDVKLKEPWHVSLENRQSVDLFLNRVVYR